MPVQNYSTNSVPKIVHFIGPSGQGKTTLITRLIRSLTRDGYRVSTVKHDPHNKASMDTRGKDSWKHHRAGAQQTFLISPQRLFLVERRPVNLCRRTLLNPPDNTETWLQTILAQNRFLHPQTDFILIEGFKHSRAYPKIVVARTGKQAVRFLDHFSKGDHPQGDDPLRKIRAVVLSASFPPVSPSPLPLPYPVFHSRTITALKSFLQRL